MGKRTSKEVRNAILTILKDGKPHSLGDIERKTGSNWKSIRNHIENLALFDAVSKKEFQKHDQNGRPYIEITITKVGLQTIKKL